MKRPVNYQQPLASVMQKEGHKKRKIQPVFLGALGSTLNMSHQQESGVVLSKSLGNDSPHQGTQQLSATAMRANPGLIGRVTSADVGAGQEEADGGRERSSSQQSPSTSHRGAGEGSSNVVEDSMNGSTFLNSTCENVEKNQRDELRTLPELNLEAAMTLKPLPRAVCLQNIAKMGLPPPQLHKALSLPVPLGPMCQVDQIVVKNALNNKRGIKYAKIQAKFGRELRWSQTVGSPLLLIHANCNWVVSAHEDNSMVVFCTPTGKISLSLHIDSPIACLEVRHQICLALTTTAELWTWDLRKSVHILRTSIKTLLLGCAAETLQIVRASLSTNGVPILVLSNGDVFIFSRSLRSWLSLNLNRDFLLSHLPSLQFIARSLPNGLISLVADILNSGKLDGRPPSTNLGEEAESANEESQLEMLLKAASELDAREEYRLLAAIYTQKLAKKRKLNKIVEFMDEVRANSSHTVGMETILTDLRLVLKQNGLSDVDAIRNDEQGRERELEASLSLLA